MISSMSEKVVGQIKEIGKDQDNVKSKKLLEKQLNKSFKVSFFFFFFFIVFDTNRHLHNISVTHIFILNRCCET